MATVSVLKEVSPAPRLVLLPKLQTRPSLSALIIFVCDLLTFTIVVLGIGLGCGHLYNARVLTHLWPCIPLLAISFALFGLYPGVTSNAVAELRRTTGAMTLVFAMFAIFCVATEGMPAYAAAVFALCWLCLLVSVPLVRSAIRSHFSSRSWWGYPVIVFGASRRGKEIIHLLQSQPALGLKPIAVMDGTREGSVCGIPILGDFEHGSSLAGALKVRHAIVPATEMAGVQVANFVELHAGVFPHLIIVPDLSGLASLGVEAADMGRSLAFTVRKRLLMRTPQLVKRCMDTAIAGVVGLLCLPLIAAIIGLIRLETKGPALYRHKRIGKHGRSFYVWKFRSMVSSADRVLEEHLRENPQAMLEWQADRKLRFDPRVTRVGSFLRKTSLDELPQLWNVLKGEMSLVGPRPIVDAEVPNYSEMFFLYKQVTPGLTGLWQVSGRNDTGYTERVALDTYYVRNWSPWLDLHILARTVRIVLTGQGAY